MPWIMSFLFVFFLFFFFSPVFSFIVGVTQCRTVLKETEGEGSVVDVSNQTMQTLTFLYMTG